MPNLWSIRPNEHFEENNVVQNKISFVFFKVWAINAGTLPKNIWMRSLNWKLQIQGIKFYHISWWSMTHFVNFRLLAELFRRVYRNCSLRALRIVLKAKGSFERRNVFLKIFRVRAKQFEIFDKKSARKPNICSISPEEYFEIKQCCEEENSFVFFRLWAKNAGKLPKKLLAAFSKLKVTYPGH